MNGKLRNGQTKYKPHPNRITGYAWMKIREQVLRLEPICYICKAKGKITLATEVDHVVALINGGSNELSNLRGICTSDHVAKTRKDMGWNDKPEIGNDGWPIE